MQRYPVRNTHRSNLTSESLARILGAHFESVGADGERRTASFGALTRIAVRGVGREIEVDVTMNPKVAEEVARDTIARYNAFLEEVTGYTAKERAKKLRKSATSGAEG